MQFEKFRNITRINHELRDFLDKWGHVLVLLTLSKLLTLFAMKVSLKFNLIITDILQAYTFGCSILSRLENDTKINVDCDC